MAPIVLTFVLSKLMESSLLQSYKMFHGNLLELFQRPLSGSLLVISLIVLVLSVIAEIRKKKSGFAADIEM